MRALPRRRLAKPRAKLLSARALPRKPHRVALRRRPATRSPAARSERPAGPNPGKTPRQATLLRPVRSEHQARPSRIVRNPVQAIRRPHGRAPVRNRRREILKPTGRLSLRVTASRRSKRRPQATIRRRAATQTAPAPCPRSLTRPLQAAPEGGVRWIVVPTTPRGGATFQISRLSPARPAPSHSPACGTSPRRAASEIRSLAAARPGCLLVRRREIPTAPRSIAPPTAE